MYLPVARDETTRTNECSGVKQTGVGRMFQASEDCKGVERSAFPDQLFARGAGQRFRVRLGFLWTLERVARQSALGKHHQSCSRLGGFAQENPHAFEVVRFVTNVAIELRASDFESCHSPALRRLLK